MVLAAVSVDEIRMKSCIWFRCYGRIFHPLNRFRRLNLTVLWLRSTTLCHLVYRSIFWFRISKGFEYWREKFRFRSSHGSVSGELRIYPRWARIYLKLEVLWGIESSIVDALNLSAELRYSWNWSFQSDTLDTSFVTLAWYLASVSSTRPSLTTETVKGIFPAGLGVNSVKTNWDLILTGFQFALFLQQFRLV